MEFKPVRAQDKERIESYLQQIETRSCDMAFASIYLWRSHYHMEYAECENTIIFRSNEENMSFSFPIGGGDVDAALRQLKEYCVEKGIPLVLHSVTKEIGDYLNEHYPGEFEIKYDRDIADYIYETEALIGLKGKKYHGKKNHVNKFMKTYDWSYEEVGPDNLEECLSMLRQWKRNNCEKEDPEMVAEICVAEAALIEKDFLGLKAGLIRADGRVVAFSVGEKIHPDTFCVHIEKAYADVPGAYAVINQQFLIHEAADCRYVNREDDVGEPGLRRAKLSYHPVFMVEKGGASAGNIC